jgi:hypothetical protein
VSRPIAAVEVPRAPVQPPPERLFLFVCDQPDPAASVINNYQLAGIQNHKGIESPVPQWRRATPEDLLAFGFRVVPEPFEGDMGQRLRSFAITIDKLTEKERVTVLAFLRERYG